MGGSQKLCPQKTLSESVMLSVILMQIPPSSPQCRVTASVGLNMLMLQCRSSPLETPLSVIMSAPLLSFRALSRKLRTFKLPVKLSAILVSFTKFKFRVVRVSTPPLLLSASNGCLSIRQERVRLRSTVGLEKTRAAGRLVSLSK